MAVMPCAVLCCACSCTVWVSLYRASRVQLPMPPCPLPPFHPPPSYVIHDGTPVLVWPHAVEVLTGPAASDLRLSSLPGAGQRTRGGTGEAEGAGATSRPVSPIRTRRPVSPLDASVLMDRTAHDTASQVRAAADAGAGAAGAGAGAGGAGAGGGGGGGPSVAAADSGDGGPRGARDKASALPSRLKIKRSSSLSSQLPQPGLGFPVFLKYVRALSRSMVNEHTPWESMRAQLELDPDEILVRTEEFVSVEVAADMYVAVAGAP